MMVVRKSRKMASSAPTAGPVVVPRYWIPATVLRLLFNLWSGTMTLTRATDAGTNPEKNPWQKSAIERCQGSCARAAKPNAMLAR